MFGEKHERNSLDWPRSSRAPIQIQRANGVGAAAGFRFVIDSRYRDALRRFVARCADIVFNPPVLIHRGCEAANRFRENSLSDTKISNLGPVFAGPFSCRNGRRADQFCDAPVASVRGVKRR